MIKLKSLLTENRLRELERSEIAHVNKEFERLIRGNNSSWEIGANPSIYNFKDGTRNFQLIASIGKDSIQLNFNLSSFPSSISATQINFKAHEYTKTIQGKKIMDTTWKIKVDDDTDLVKLFKKDSKIKSNVKKAIKKIEDIREKAAEVESAYYKSGGR